MLVWSVGLIPVQEWISEARRSRDLKMGSALLSWLMARTLKALGEHATVFVPALQPQDIDDVAAKRPAELLSVDYGIPNRATGWWFAGDPVPAFNSLQNQIDESWNAFRDAVEPRVVPRILAPYVASARNPIRVVWCTQPMAVAESRSPRTSNATRSRPSIDSTAPSNAPDRWSSIHQAPWVSAGSVAGATPPVRGNGIPGETSSAISKAAMRSRRGTASTRASVFAAYVFSNASAGIFPTLRSRRRVRLRRRSGDPEQASTKTSQAS